MSFPVTVDPKMLQVILDDLESGKSLSQNDRDVLATALEGKQITLSGEERAVAIGGNADNAVIVTGDRNILISKEMAQALQEKIQAVGSFEQQIGDRQSTTYNFFLNLGDDAKSTQVQQQLGLLLQQLPGEVLQQAYRNALPIDANLSRPQTSNPDEMVANLQDFRRLTDFVQQLVGDERLSQLNREKLAETIELPKTSQPIAPPSTLLQSYLLIAVRPKQDADTFVVNGWLIPDDTVQDGAKRFQPLDIDAAQKGKECDLSQMPQVVDELVQLSLDYLLGKQFELTIEMFLPLGYLHEGIDVWKILDLDEEISIGTRYRVLVRTYDRLTPKYLSARLKDWRTNWQRVQEALDNTPNPDNDFEHLQDYGNFNSKRLENSLTQKLGLKLTCGLDEEYREAVIKAVHRSATPIAIWSRCSLLHLDLVSEMNTIISSSCLAGLAEAIRQKRLAADLEDDPELHLGKHLAIMWEDPDRLTPDVRIPLESPGQ